MQSAFWPSPDLARPAPRPGVLRALAWGWGLLLAGLSVPWGYTFLVGWLFGAVPRISLAIFLAGLILATGLGAWLRGKRSLVGPLVAGAMLFAMATAVLAVARSEAPIPMAGFAPLYVLSSLWVIAVAGAAALPRSPLTRWGVTLSLAVMPFLLLATFRSSGFTGDGKIKLVWRASPSAVEILPSNDNGAAAVDLVHATPADFPQYLGPTRDARLPGPRLNRDWSARPPRLLWRKSIGQGWGSFAVVGNFAVTQEQTGDEECVVCVELKTGRERWRHSEKGRFSSSMGGDGPRATPSIDGGDVFALSALGRLSRLDGMTGKARWVVEVAKPEENLLHGMASSPLVADSRVYVGDSSKDNKSLACFDRETGRLLWREGRERCGYSSPTLVELAGKRQVLSYDSIALSGFDPITGSILWSVRWSNNESTNASQPIAPAGSPSAVFVSTGYGAGASMFELIPRDMGIEPKTVWTNRRFNCKFTTPVLWNDLILGLDNGILACLEVKTGALRWRKGRYGHGQILLVGDLLLIQTEAGPVKLVAPRPEGPVELGTLDALSQKTWNPPALAGSVLLVRNDQEAAAYELPLDDPDAASSASNRR